MRTDGISTPGYPTYLTDQTYALGDFHARLAGILRDSGFPNSALTATADDLSVTQGVSALSIARHFGRFPLICGRDGQVQTDRLLEIGQDTDALLIFLSTGVSEEASSVDEALSWYLDAYTHAQNAIRLINDERGLLVEIENELLDLDRTEGLFLDLAALLHGEREGVAPAVSRGSVTQTFRANRGFAQRIKNSGFGSPQGDPIGTRLTRDLIHFRRQGSSATETLIAADMPECVTADNPLQSTCQRLTQRSFDQAFRMIRNQQELLGTQLTVIASTDVVDNRSTGLPKVSCRPWAMLTLSNDGAIQVIDQLELQDRLAAQSGLNPEMIDLNQVLEDATG